MSNCFNITRDLRMLELVLETADRKNRVIASRKSSGFIDIAAAIRVNHDLSVCTATLSTIKEEHAMNRPGDYVRHSREIAELHNALGAVLLEIEFLYDEFKAKHLALAYSGLPVVKNERVAA